MVFFWGQQYNVGEKPIVILLYTYISNRHAGTPDKKQIQNRNNIDYYSTTSNMVVIIKCFIGCKDKASTWYLNGFSDGSNLGSKV